MFMFVSFYAHTALDYSVTYHTYKFTQPYMQCQISRQADAVYRIEILYHVLLYYVLLLNYVISYNVILFYVILYYLIGSTILRNTILCYTV